VCVCPIIKMNSRTLLSLGRMLQGLQQRCRTQCEFASAGNRIKRGEAPKIETFASEVTRKEVGGKRGTGGKRGMAGKIEGSK